MSRFKLSRSAAYVPLCLLLGLSVISEVRAGQITHVLSNTVRCPPWDCQRGDPNNPVPLTDLPFSTTFEIPQWSPNNGTLGRVEIDVFLNTQGSFTGVTTGEMTWPYGWELSRRVVLNAGNFLTIFDEYQTDAWIGAPTECGNQPPPSDQNCTVPAGETLTRGFDEDTRIGRWFDSQLDGWIGTGNVTFGLQMLDPDFHNLQRAVLGSGPVSISMPFEIQSYTMQGEMLFAQVTYTSEGGSVPEPKTLALFALGLAGIGYQRRKLAE